jgi:F420-dependent oxidoreductase-like protein
LGDTEDVMRIALMIEGQQGLHYEELLALAETAEASGFEAFFRSDHYLSFPGPPGRPATDAWTTLAGLARETRTIRLGVLVSPVTFRHPGTFAKIVATVDEMSGGRVEAGMGAGWNEAEHRAHGLPFPPIAERAAMLEEALEIVKGLWSGPDGWSYAGRYWTIEDAHFAPKPVQRPAPPIIVGGEGTPRGLRIAARHADEFNCSSSGPERVRDRFAALDAACRAIGRDPATIRRSAMVGVLVGRTEREFEARRAALAAEVGPLPDAEAWLAARAERWIIGTPEQAQAMARRYAEAGCERLMLQNFLPRDLDHVKVLAEVLIGRV